MTEEGVDLFERGAWARAKGDGCLCGGGCLLECRHLFEEIWYMSNRLRFGLEVNLLDEMIIAK